MTGYVALEGCNLIRFAETIMTCYADVNSYALDISRRVKTFDDTAKSEFYGQLTNLIDQENLLFTILSSFPETTIKQFHLATLPQTNNHQKLQQHDLLSLSTDIWPLIGQFLTQFDNAALQQVHSTIACHTSTEKYILGTRTADVDIVLDSSELFKYHQCKYYPHTMTLMLDQFHTQWLILPSFQNMFKYVTEIVIPEEYHHLLSLIPFHSIHQLKQLLLRVDFPDCELYNEDYYGQIKSNIIQCESGSIIDELAVFGDEAYDETMQAFISSLNGHFKQLTIDGFQLAFSVKQLQDTFNDTLERLSFINGGGLFNCEKSNDDLKIRSNLRVLKVEANNFNAICWKETWPILEKYGLLMKLQEFEMDYQPVGEDCLRETLCNLLSPHTFHLTCPKLRTVTINTHISDSADLQSLVDEIISLNKFGQHSIMIEQMVMNLTSDKYKHTTDIAITHEYKETQREIYELCQSISDCDQIFTREDDLYKHAIEQQFACHQL